MAPSNEAKEDDILLCIENSAGLRDGVSSPIPAAVTEGSPAPILSIAH